MDHDRIDELLGAWAVDACEPGEHAAVESHLAGCPACASEAPRLRGAAATLAGPAAPPVALRGRVLGGLRARRPPAPAYAEPYAAQVAALEALLAELGPPQWATTVIHDWSVQDLLAHLSATDGLVADALAPSPPGTDDDVWTRTGTLIRRERGHPPERTRAAWREQADVLCGRLPSHTGPREPVVAYGGQRRRVPDLMVARAFETWIHADDIARAVGHPLPGPLPRHLRPIADLGVRSLPHALRKTGADPGDRAARITLTGEGGGEWTLGLTPGRRTPPETIPAVHVEMDVLEFCFLAGGRRDPATVPAALHGDHPLGTALLTAAPAFAGH